mgnify:CR=1 FL=1
MDDSWWNVVVLRGIIERYEILNAKLLIITADDGTTGIVKYRLHNKKESKEPLHMIISD